MYVRTYLFYFNMTVTGTLKTFFLMYSNDWLSCDEFCLQFTQTFSIPIMCNDVIHIINTEEVCMKHKQTSLQGKSWICKNYFYKLPVKSLLC